ncbi:Splicing factor [Scheffersomyces spartinae]|uniref:Splicing factor n=1 Tax=Scheffersomyces spartinae TaxID=45513 RepID=A0A9P7V9X5_9ASCO|nr:Splicing factor [Scheffersomyces spartinae]KAG7194126.1 Splicing factor [Scheffersomyces spartinae]
MADTVNVDQNKDTALYMAVSPTLLYTPWLTLLRASRNPHALIEARMGQIRLQVLSKHELAECYKDAELADSWLDDALSCYVDKITECIRQSTPAIWLVDEDGNIEEDIEACQHPEKSRFYRYGRFHWLESHQTFNKVQQRFEDKSRSVDDWRNLFTTQLSTPHVHLDDTFSFYSSFVSQQYPQEEYATLMIDGNKLYKKTKHQMRYYETLEAQLKEDPKDIETWKTYIASVKKYQPEAVEVLFWRTSEYFEPGDSNWFKLWVFYLDLMKEEYFGDPKEEYMFLQFHRCFPNDPVTLGAYLLTVKDGHLILDLVYVRRAVMDYLVEVRSNYSYERWKFAAMVFLAFEVSRNNSIYYYGMKILSFLSKRPNYDDDTLVSFITKLIVGPTKGQFWSLLNASVEDDYGIDIVQQYVDINQEEDHVMMESRKRPRLDEDTTAVTGSSASTPFWVQVSNIPSTSDSLSSLINVEIFDLEYLDDKRSVAIFKVHGEPAFQSIMALNGTQYNGNTLLIEAYEQPTLWCSHYPDDLPKSELDSMFNEFGKVIKAVHPYMKKYSFYVFEDPKDASSAINSLNKKVLYSKDGKKKYTLAVHRASKAFNQSKEPLRDRQVFINRLNFVTTKESVTNVFLEFGNIEKIIMPTMEAEERETERNKGFAKIIYSNGSSANKALSMNGVELDGRRLAVTLDDGIRMEHTTTEHSTEHSTTEHSRSVIIMPFECSKQEAYTLIWNLVGPIELFTEYGQQSKAYLFKFGSREDAVNAQVKLKEAGLDSLKVVTEDEYNSMASHNMTSQPKRRLMVPTSVRRRAASK